MMSTLPSAATGEKASQGSESRYDIARDCVHCGLCLPVCPTYVQLGHEADSPRGRIYLMRAYEEGRQEITAGFKEHLDLCLVCRACETACPSGVRFGSMMEEFRALIHSKVEGSAPGILQRFHARLGRWLLLQVIPHRRRLRALVSGLRFYQASGLAELVRRSRLLRLLHLEQLEALRPAVPPASARRSWSEVIAPYGNRRARVLFLRGCVTPELLPEMQLACIEALRHNGCEVVTPHQQTCCGALHFHMGYAQEGLKLLEQNLSAFDLRDVDAVVVSAAGCGSTLKEYGHLAAERAPAAAAATTFAASVRDISEFLADIGLLPPRYEVRARVAYDEPCHLLHGQGISAAPKQLLDTIPGLERVFLQDAEHCCGSGGVYNVLHPELAGEILDEKIQNIAASQADIVATGNPGCILQIRSGLVRGASRQPHLARVEVVHPIQLLTRAYTGAAS